MRGTTNRTAVFRTIAAVMTVAALALAIAGCSSGTTQPENGTKTMTMAGGAVQASNSMSGSSTPSGMSKVPDPNAQQCATCMGEEPAAPVTGSVKSAHGTQIIAVSIKDGSYTPNRFVAKAGSPITVLFTVDGKPAKGCLANPTFKKLDKSVKITTGDVGIDLGTLAPGTYEFACSMGMNVGSIVVQ